MPARRLAERVTTAILLPLLPLELLPRARLENSDAGALEVVYVLIGGESSWLNAVEVMGDMLSPMADGVRTAIF